MSKRGRQLVEDVTQILDAIGRGDQQAAEELLPVLYEDLRRLAAKKLATEPPGQTLQATALVHEAWMRLLASDKKQKWDHRGHFFLAAAEAMRRILIENARRKQTLKRGGIFQQVQLEEAHLVSSIPADQLLDVNEALEELSEELPEEAKLIKLRYFGGLTIEEAAEVIGISRKVAYRYWRCARAFLLTALSDDDPDDLATPK